MTTTVKQAFEEYKSNLEITDKQTSLVSQRRSNVVAALGKSIVLHGDGGMVIGSWDRNTLTRYLSEGDVDVMVVMHYGNNKAWDNTAGTIKALDCFKRVLDDAYPNTYKRRDRNCITMQFSEFRLDVVPAFKYDGGYYQIPDSIRQQWVPTNPFAFAALISQVNGNMGGTFVPLIKMVKGWNRNVGWPIRSFHLECMMYNHYESYTQAYTYPSTLDRFFSCLPSYLQQRCYDPVQGDRIDDYLDNAARKTDRQIAIEKATSATAAATEAYADSEKYPSVAIGEWKAIFGEFFPRYS